MRYENNDTLQWVRAARETIESAIEGQQTRGRKQPV